MEVREGLVLEAITHAIRSVERRREGLENVAARHTAAATALLMKVAEGTAGEMNAAPSAHAARVGGARAG